MRATHIGSDHQQRREWFACPGCGSRAAITEEEWSRVPVIGEKPALGCACGLEPHIPPSPATVAAHDREVAILTMVAAVAGDPGPRPKTTTEQP